MARWTDIAQWRGPTVNEGDGDGITEASDRLAEHRGVIVHIAEGTFEGTIAWQRNPSADVSSHFVVAKDGRIAQVVDTSIRAWTQRSGNSSWLSIENEGFIPGALTAAQVTANAKILARANQVHGVPLQLATSPSGRGLGHHSMGAESGADWGHSQCPGPAIKAQKPEILRQAQQIVNGEDDDMTPDESRMLRNADRLVSALIGGATQVTGIEWPAGVKKTYPLEIAAQTEAAAVDAKAGRTAAEKALTLVAELAQRPAPGTVVVTDEQFERVLRKVIGSVG